MIVYRISYKKYIEDLSGAGAWNTGGRWNSQYKSMLYTSENLSLAALEVLVNIRLVHVKTEFERMSAAIFIPDHVPIKTMQIEDLPKNWSSQNQPPELKKIGDKWIESLETLVLKVPSSVIQSEFNFLINPRHPVFSKVKIESTQPFNFDERLFFPKS